VTPLVRCDGAARTFGAGPGATVALQPTTCEVFPGARIAVAGPSGSGKSTLLHLMAGLDEPTLGTVEWPAIGGRDDLRPGPVGVVFQGPSLLPPLTVAENVALPLLLARRDERSAAEAVLRALHRLGLAGLADKLPDEISGGQAQRVAVARAVVGNPVLVLADEPTGQLDHPNASAVVDLLLETAGRP
jgi:ABC-type lipoprotein export system ATPase subunit